MLHHRRLDENTLLILTTDHGIEFTGAKITLREQGTGVFLIIRGPGGFSGGKVVEFLVSQLDIAPTILDVAGLPPCAWHEGRSLVLLAADPSRELRDAVFTEQNYHGPLEALRAIRTARYRYLLHHDPVGYRMRHDGPTCPLMESFGAYDQPTGYEELFDLYLEPMEACNRVSDPAYAAIKADLRARLEAWMLETGDCFPGGQFPPIPARSSA